MLGKLIRALNSAISVAICCGITAYIAVAVAHFTMLLLGEGGQR